MLSWTLAIVALVLAYLIGAVPFALIVGKVYRGIDLREHGSGNLGATNVFRVLGWKAGIVAALLDVAKGAAAVGVAVWLHPASAGEPAFDWMLICSMIAAMAGHSYSPYIRFAGGKGVAVAGGGLLIITPLAWPILFLIFALIVVIGRMVSLGSVITAASFPFLVLWLYPDRTPIVALSFGAAALV
ncbi:MAG: glycerol-3-phosphate 1-O-acyltransferase, partial [Myxococcales bacterium]